MAETMSTEDADRLQAALELATEAHRGQYRKYTGEPYVIHPIRVMLSLVGDPADVQIAAVLHDTVEDTSVILAMVEAMFGPEVERLVDALTRRDGEKYADFITRIIDAGADAMFIKMADVRDNMVNGSPGRADRYSKSYKRLVDAWDERPAAGEANRASTATEPQQSER